MKDLKKFFMRLVVAFSKEETKQGLKEFSDLLNEYSTNLKLKEVQAQDMMRSP